MDEWDWAEQWNLEYRRLIYIGASLVAQLVKSLPAMQETWVQSLGWEDPLENGMAILSSILAWRIPWSIPCGYKESDTAEWRSLSLYIYMCIYVRVYIWTGRPGVLWFMVLQRVGHDWATELNWYIYTHTYSQVHTHADGNIIKLMAAAAAAAKLLQSCPTLCDPIDGSPTGSPVPGILQARTLEWVAISFSNACKWKVKVKSLSRVWLLATPWTAAHQAPPSMGFSRQEYGSGVPLPSPN